MAKSAVNRSASRTRSEELIDAQVVNQLPGTAAKARITILHYSAPPIVGGVEHTIYHHARLLAQAGYQVRVIAGRGEAFHPRVALHVLPEMDSRHPQVLAVKEELDRGQVTPQFGMLRDRVTDLLRPYIANTDVLIAHNLFTLHKNLPLTAALHRLLTEEPPPHPRTLAWHHDLAWQSRQYKDEMYTGYPWDLLRQPWPGVTQVTVSEPRRREVAALYSIAPEAVKVVPPGVDLPTFFRWTETTQHIESFYHLLDADLVLLLPARITRRKNIQLAVQVLAALREQTGLDARLVVTGPPGPHNPANVAYLAELQSLRRDLNLLNAAHFVYELGEEKQPLVPDNATMANLYLIADALLFPSLGEGFGIPMLEAGLLRLPIFCSRIPPLEATGGIEVHYFSPQADPAHVAALIASKLLADPAFRLRRRVLQEYRWETIVNNRVIPLIEEQVEE
nr:glycosyltransferase family 4 protein [Chloroflexota bacterium]